MTIVTRPINENERDFLIEDDLIHLPFILKDINDVEQMKVCAPEGGWTHDMLENIDCYKHCPFGWNAYLGSKHWIGSSEV